MNEKDKILGDIKKLVKQYFSLEEDEFIPGKTLVPLAHPPFSWEESNEAIDSILTGWVTMGEKVRKFENVFSEYTNCKHGTMVNSGSSANLLALSILSNPQLKHRIKSGDEIITPAVTWVTTVYPMINVNAKPVLVDVGLDYNINTDQIKEAITERTKAIMPVHLMGNPCNIKGIMEIADENDLLVIEDACEAHGAEVDGKKVGSFGDIGTFSFFLSHHITTIEGGMVVTNNDAYDELAKALRAFGWIRDLKDKEKYEQRYSNIDPRFLFINLGFNIRPTEIQGAFGLHQIRKLENFIKIRQDNAAYWNKRLEEFSDFFVLPEQKKGTRHVWLGYPLTVKSDAPFTREQLVKFLETKKIETRPMMAGNIVEQPVSELMNYKVHGNLENSKLIMKNSFWFGNHNGIGREQREYVADSIEEFVRSMVKHA